MLDDNDCKLMQAIAFLCVMLLILISIIGAIYLTVTGGW